MTSINALRFDQYSGAMVCDEQRHWNPERVKIYAADKIRSIIPAEIRERYGLAACYGNTGTSSVGDELRLTIYREVEMAFERKCKEYGEIPAEFMSLKEIVNLAWHVITRMKHRHVNEELRHRYGFETAELIQGFKVRNGENCAINNKNIVKEALDKIAGDPINPKPDPVFGNGGIIAGFDAEHGFRVYVFSMKEAFVEPSETGYAALGSGGDTTNFILPRYFNKIG
ncbi:hypothetical protein JW979_16305, partial [bacterium]|nr:hypothetical protein [candidate division CSSED10-310 bacterium]